MLTLAFKLDIGFVAITIGLVLSLIAPNLQKRAIGQVTWPEIMLITGVSTYVFVLEKMGTIDFVGHSVAGLGTPLLAALLLCLIGAVVSAFASSTAVLGSLIPLAVPFLQGESGVGAIGFIAAMAVSSTIVDVSPFSTNGALVLASAQGVDRDVFFRKLLIYGAIVTLVAPVVVWLLFVVLCPTARRYSRMNTSFFQELLGSIAERGRALVDRSATRPAGKGARRAKAAGNAGEPLPGPGLGPRRGVGRGAGPAGARPLCRLARDGSGRVLPPARQRLRS